MVGVVLASVVTPKRLLAVVALRLLRLGLWVKAALASDDSCHGCRHARVEGVNPCHTRVKFCVCMCVLIGNVTQEQGRGAGGRGHAIEARCGNLM